jgi:Lrp/AsnC family leucine-responsive transcriptional regulator
MDDIDRQLIRLLAADARMPLKDLAAGVGLSSPGTADRLRRLVQRGIVRAFSVEVDPHALGYSLQAIVRIKPLPGQMQAVQQILSGIGEVAECDKVTGDDCFFARVHLRSVEHLDFILAQIADKADTSTAIVKSQPVKRRLPRF